MSLVKIQNEPCFVKDTGSGAVINIDNSGRASYLRQRKQMEDNKLKMQEYENQIRTLTDEVCSIKDMLINILNRVK